MTHMFRGFRKRAAAGQQYAIIVGLIAVIALAGVATTGGRISTLFTKTSNVLGSVNNSVSVAPPAPPDTTPDTFTFTDQTAVSLSTLIESNILQITGHDGVTVSISGGGSPQFRICADASCTSVVQAYGSTSQTIANGQYLQLRLTSSASSNTAISATVSAGTVSDTWSVTTSTSLYSFTSHTFSTCSVSGFAGPSLAQCRAAYSTGWDENSSFFNMTTNGIQEWTVPETANYTIEAVGAGGGVGGSTAAGRGARMIGTFSLTQGQVLKILVGQQGSSGGVVGGGGGGSFVTNSSNTALIVAGGGGGAYSSFTTSQATVTDASTGTSGLRGPNGGTAGTSGGGGGAGNSGSSAPGGGGLTGNGADRSSGGSFGGKSFTNGGVGGNPACSPTNAGNGGFGGGGAGEWCTCGDAGGGGGYSGGAGGGAGCGGGTGGGGGGGSINTGTSQTNSAGYNGSAGYVVITKQ